MIVQCKDGQSLFESRDMGATWTKAIGTLSGVWTNSRLGVFREDNLPVEAPIIATIEGVKVMLYTWEGCFSGDKKENVFHLWVMENNRTFSVGRVAMDNKLGTFFTSCCTRMVRCTFYRMGLLKQATTFHLSH
ncbi:putative trans-sialidase [Trypanosoma cruzi]|nr:putative trans-sialidase [Trypanosoma cruzi]